MSGIFSTFNTANKGLMASQTALQTTSHNISNANTEGFSRQRVDLKSDLAYNFAGVGQLGTGVKMEAIVRLVDNYVGYQIRNENATLSKYNSKIETMEQLEIVFNEPSESGLNSNIAAMFDSWSELSKTPENINASKTMVVENSRIFAETLNHMASQLNDLKTDTINQTENDVYDVNAILKNIEVLNQQIFKITIKGEAPNDLLDQRDLLLKDLSSLTNFSSDYDKYGGVSIEVDGNQLVGPNVEYEMSMVKSIVDNGTDYTVTLSKQGDKADTITFNTTDIYNLGQIVINKNDESLGGAPLTGTDVVPIDIEAGSIAGRAEAMEEIDNRKSDLDTFAKVVGQAINRIHNDTGGTDPLASTIDFFNFEDVDGDGNIDYTAESISVVENLINDDTLVNAGFGASPAGDGARALAISNLRNTNLEFTNTATLTYDPATMKIASVNNGLTIEGDYSAIVTKVGVATQYAQKTVANQETLLNQLEFKRESVSGVSIDEEVTNLITFQKAYEANAKVITTVTEMLDALINMVR